MPPDEEKVEIWTSVVIQTTYHKSDFESQEEWDAFKMMIWTDNSKAKEVLAEHVIDDGESLKDRIAEQIDTQAFVTVNHITGKYVE